MNTALLDIKYAFRSLSRNIPLTATAVLTLALAAGINIAIFTLINNLLLRPYPYKDPDQLVVVTLAHQESGLTEGELAIHDFAQFRAENQVFESFGAANTGEFIIGEDGESFSVEGGETSADFFKVLGIEPIMGRTFLPEEEHAGAGQVVLLGQQLWKQRFGSDPNILGTTIPIDGERRTIIGVLPEYATIPDLDDDTDALLFIPLAVFPNDDDEARLRRDYFCLARLKSGITTEQAESDLDLIVGRLGKIYPRTHTGLSTYVMSLRYYRSRDHRGFVIPLFFFAGVVVMIACFNVANLLLQRGILRQRELALRVALGAGRGRLLRQLLMENGVLSLIATTVGLLIGHWIFQLVIGLFPPDQFESYLTVFHLDVRVLAYVATMTLVTVMLFGLVPSWKFSNQNLAGFLKESSKGATGGVKRQRFRSFLLVGEVSLSITSLIVAGFMLRTFINVMKIDTGLSPENILTMKVDLLESQYPERRRRAAFFGELIDRVRNLPGVESVAASRDRPLASWSRIRIALEDQAPDDARQNPWVFFQFVDGDYFETLRQRLVQGKNFDHLDTFDSRPVAIINQDLARQFWPDQNPIGKRFKASARLTGHEQWISIVGIVEGVTHNGPREGTSLDFYLPYDQVGFANMELLVRTFHDPMSLAENVRAALHTIDPNIPGDDIYTLAMCLREKLWMERTSLIIFGVFGGISLFLVIVGLYATIGYSVAARTNEIGIRMALGARSRDVLWMVIGGAAAVVGIGLVVGLAAAVGVSRYLASMLFGVSTYDPTTYVGVSLLMVAVSVAAVFIPARRASRIDPVQALRTE